MTIRVVSWSLHKRREHLRWLLGMVLAFSIPALGQGQANPALASALRQRGTWDLDAHNYEEAARSFSASWDADPRPETLYDAARASNLAGWPADALKFYESFLAHVPDAKERDEVKHEIERLRSEVGLVSDSLPIEQVVGIGERRTFICPQEISRLSNTAPAIVLVAKVGARAVRFTGVSLGVHDVALWSGHSERSVRVTVIPKRAEEPRAESPQLSKATALLAVLELRSKLSAAEAKRTDAGYLTDLVRSAALEAGVRVMTKENLISLLESQGKKLEDCEGECEVDTGRRLGADLVATGEILRFGSSLIVNLKLHETHAGQLLSAARATGKTPDELSAGITKTVAELLKPMRSSQ